MSATLTRKELRKLITTYLDDCDKADRTTAKITLTKLDKKFKDA
jgi:hypothetical protein